MTLDYNITREDAADILGMSTRTIDRKIRKGVFGYKKIANKVYMAMEEIQNYKNKTEQVYTGGVSQSVSTNIALPSAAEIEDIKDMLNYNFEKFWELIRQKENQVNEKNNIIFGLQAKVVELETKLGNVQALPEHIDRIRELENKLKDSVTAEEYNRYQERMLIEKEKQELEYDEIKSILKKEKIKNLLYVVMIIIIVVFIFSRFFS